MSVTIQIPDVVFSGSAPDISRQVLESVALEGFRTDQLSTEQVRRLLGLASRLEVHEFLGEHGVPWVRYSVEDAERERALLRRLIP